VTGSCPVRGGRAVNGAYELEYEVFGDAASPAVLLVNGLGSQMLGYRPAFCQRLVDAGFMVIRYDNRDVGNSTLTPCVAPPIHTVRDALRNGDPVEIPYTIKDMAADGIAVLDALGVDRAHVFGMSMGGMIVQTMGYTFGERLLSVISVMSSTGNPKVGVSTPEAAAMLVATRPDDVEEAIAMDVAEWRLTAGDHFDEAEVTEYVRAQYRRGRHPNGMAFQFVAVIEDGDRTERLGTITVPTTVIHGEADPLITPSGGKATAAAVPGANLVLVPGMGHHLAPEVWDVCVEVVADHQRRVDSSAPR
jgi:pimeloyl-ACP methyl ester carboxylesterase